MHASSATVNQRGIGNLRIPKNTEAITWVGWAVGLTRFFSLKKEQLTGSLITGTVVEIDS